MTKVYDLEGIEHEKTSVDARECVSEMGWSLTPKVKVEEAPAQEESAPDEVKVEEARNKGR